MIRVIDIETTGIDPATDAIIEIASVDMVRDGAITNAMDTLVRSTKPIPAGASAVHHIVDEDVANAPPFAEVINRFKGADFYVAHNSEFERSFLAAQGVELGSWICTYKCALRVWPDFPSHGNQALRYQLGLINPLGVDRAKLVPHRALSDAIVRSVPMAREKPPPAAAPCTLPTTTCGASCSAIVKA